MRQNSLVIVAVFVVILGVAQASPVINREEAKHQVSEAIKKLDDLFKEKIELSPPCVACEILLPILHKALLENQTEQIEFITEKVCNLFKIENPIVCHQVIDEYAFSVITVVLTTSVSDKDLCAAFLDCGSVDSPLLNWNITLPNVPKPPVVPPTPPKAGAPTLRILHLSDIHIDFEYQAGALAVCSEPICCRNQSTPKVNQHVTPDQMAGYWGDVRNCDIPLYTVENLFNHLSKNEKFDYVYWTGDLPPHNVWHQNRNESINALRVLTSLFLKYFPGKIIYPSLGNHEAAPCNLYPTPVTTADSIDWLYTELADDWIKTGLPSSLVSNIKYGAFYYLDIQPGLRLISMNMNYCPTLNFWLFINSTDPLNQLSWLANTLQDCENKGIKAHIIGHVNPAGCMSSWSFNYYRIVNRYESTIAGQFFGHTHNDEMEIFYDLNDPNRPTNVAYVTGSVTTQPNLFPGYRVYTVDGGYAGASYYVMDHDNYILNLTDANLTDVPKWTKEYSAKDAFGFENMFPVDWNNLVTRLLKNPSDPLADKFHTYYWKSLDTRPPCDAQCLRNFLCDFKQARPGNLIQC